MRILHIAIQLLKDYEFLSFPLPFEKYQINAGQYRLTTLKVVTYSLTTPLIQSCRTDSTLRVYKLFVKIITTLRAFMAGNNSQLCMHLSVTTDEHFCLFVYSLHQQQMSFGLQMDSGSGSPQASFPFEKRNTKLPDALSQRHTSSHLQQKGLVPQSKGQ